ncbi:MAG: hypothetical protein L3V56_01540 [Candidatus Magnetoovum sp. WYHC-5]|nr:hypothetical protein [Candidatus Magnetoovum sp. WYHC-5]
MSLINRVKLLLYSLLNYVPGLRKIDINKVKANLLILRKLFKPKNIKFTKDKMLVLAKHVKPLEVRINKSVITVYGGVVLSSQLVFLSNKLLNIEKKGEKTLYDGTLWFENSLFYGNVGNLCSLNIISGSIIHSNIKSVEMLYIREGYFNGTIDSVIKWIHLANPSSTLKGHVKEIGETIFFDNGTMVVDTLPKIHGGYMVIKYGKMLKSDGSCWDWIDILKNIESLIEDQEIFLFGSGGNVLLGGNTNTVLFKEGVDTYSRHKTETIIASNNFYRLSKDNICQVKVKIANNQKISIPAGEFYKYVRLSIVDEN